MHHLNVCVIGAGFVGLTLTGKILKNPDTTVVLVENNKEKCQDLQNKNFQIYEPGLVEILAPALLSEKLKISNTAGNENFDAVFVCIGTQQLSQDPNGFQNLIDVVDGIKTNIKNGGYIFIRSTVQLGVTEKISQHLRNSRPDINLSFAPERTVEGIALIELDQLPQILGVTSGSDAVGAEGILQKLGFIVRTASNSNCAEFIKLISNSWRDTQFAISNEIAMLSEVLSIDPYEVIELCNYNYPRSAIPKPGPVGGPCLSKDTHILFDVFSESEKNSSLIFNARLKNQEIFKLAYSLISEFQAKISRKVSILFLGAAFKSKPITNDLRKGLAESIILELSSDKFSFEIWDPNINVQDISNLPAKLVKDFRKLMPDVIIFGNNNPILTEPEFSQYYSGLPQSTLIVDFWGLTDKLEITLSNLYVFGRGLKSNQ